MHDLVNALRACGDLTRLRILLLLRQEELTVSELTSILSQSQPGVSRHLKLLCSAHLLERSKEGSWVFYRASDEGLAADLAHLVRRWGEQDKIYLDDQARLAKVREARAARSAAFFKANAAQWERIRALHAPDKDVEAAILRQLGGQPIDSLLDAATGTGRILEVLAPHAKRAIGIDVSPDMLRIARERIVRAKLTHCQLRLGDINHLPFPAGTKTQGFDAVVIHQALHYLGDPRGAISSAAQTMRSGGKLLIADFASHDLEFLRDEYAHRRLGFADGEVAGWLKAAGLRFAGTEAIEPAKSSRGKLTVKIWMGTRLLNSGSAGRAARSTRAHIENV